MTLNGCEVLGGAKGTRHVELGPNVDAAIVSANRSRGKVSILGNVGP